MNEIHSVLYTRYAFFDETFSKNALFIKKALYKNQHFWKNYFFIKKLFFMKMNIFNKIRKIFSCFLRKMKKNRILLEFISSN